MLERHWRSVLEVAGRQRALVTTAQLRRCGVPPRTTRDAVDAGLLVPERRGVLRLAGAPDDPQRPLLAACLAAGGDAVASHLSAAPLWDFRGIPPGAVEITLFLRRAPRLEGVRSHQSMKLFADDRTERDGIPVTSAARTAVDLASCVSWDVLSRFVDHVLRVRHLDLDELVDRLDGLGGQGRPGTRSLRSVVLELQEGLRPGDSDLEVRVLRRLLRLGVPRPVQGLQVECGTRVFLLDLAWPELRIAVEVDGFAHHSSRAAFDHDRERDLLLRRAGWEVIRVSSRTDLRLVANHLIQRALVCGIPHTSVR